MGRIRKVRVVTCCIRCGSLIPSSRRADALYCKQSCRAASEKLRYKAGHPDYVVRQLRLVSEIKHLSTYGHLRFLDNPLLNPKDKFRVARSLGYRSMLEVDVARQLETLGVPFVYEPFKISYLDPIPPRNLTTI